MKKRVISAAIALAIFIPLIILGGYYFAGGIVVLGIIGYFELLNLKKDNSYPLAVKVLGAIFLVILILSNYSSPSFALIYDFKVIIALIFTMMTLVIGYNDNEKFNTNDALYIIGSTLFLGIAFNLFLVTRNIDVKILVMLFLTSTMTDMFAQFFGSLIGRHKFAPAISPKKTWEGAIMGSITSTFIVSTFYLTIIDKNANILLVVGLIFLLTLVGQLGDLIFSAIKRLNKVKDFSNIMPGHGGILDRLDSLIFILMAFMIIERYF